MDTPEGARLLRRAQDVPFGWVVRMDNYHHEPMHATHQRGAVAEAAIALAAIKAGIGVLKPLSDGERYDLIFDLRPKLLRVQCKAASLYDDVVVVRSRSGRRTRHGVVMRAYTSEEVDAFAAYCGELDKCFLLPIDRFDGQKAIQLRVRPTRNNQAQGINWAEEYDLAATLSRLQGP